MYRGLLCSPKINKTKSTSFYRVYIFKNCQTLNQGHKGRKKNEFGFYQIN